MDFDRVVEFNCLYGDDGNEECWSQNNGGADADNVADNDVDGEDDRELEVRTYRSIKQKSG